MIPALSTSNPSFSRQYFQRKIDDRQAEIGRLRPRQLMLEQLLKQWPDSKDIRKALGKVEAEMRRIRNEQHKYLARIGK